MKVRAFALLLVFQLASLGWAQSWYIGASQSFVNFDSNITGSFGFGLGARLDRSWNLRSGGIIQVARTFGLVGLTIDGLYSPPEGGYVGLGLGWNYAIVPALSSNLETTVRTVLGNEWLVTPFWGVFLETQLLHNLTRKKTVLDWRMGLNIFFKAQQ